MSLDSVSTGPSLGSRFLSQEATNDSREGFLATRIHENEKPHRLFNDTVRDGHRDKIDRVSRGRVARIPTYGSRGYNAQFERGECPSSSAAHRERRRFVTDKRP